MNSLLEELTPDVVVLTEHCLSKANLLNTRINGFDLTADFSRQHHQKGGVAIYINKELECEVCPLSTDNHSIELICELAAINITINKENIYVIGVYRPDRDLAEAMEAISNFLETIPVWHSTVVIMGDINIDCLNTSRRSEKQRNNKLLETLASYNIHRLNLPPTRITPHSKTSIDMVASNNDTSEIAVDILTTGIADHTGQLNKLNIIREKEEKCTTKTRNLSESNLKVLKNLLQRETWTEVYNSDGVENAYNHLHETILFNLNIACPLQKIKTKQKNTLSQIRDEEALLKKAIFIKAQETYLLAGTPENKAYAALKKKEYDLHLKDFRKKVTSNHITTSSNKSKAIWKVINSERFHKQTKKAPIKLEVDGAITEDPYKVATQLNTYFANVTNNILAQSEKERRPELERPEHLVQEYLILTPTSYDEVLKTINSMQPKNSAGLDEMSTKLLKICSESLASPIADTINKSFYQGIFPSKLKEAKIYPKFKQGNTTKEENYRPISLLPAISKIFEKVVLTRLLDHLSRHGLLPVEQHGFIRSRSTTTAAISLIEYLIKAIESGETTTAIFLDYTKAFDCLNHEMLLNRLEDFGIRGLSVNWFRSYLKDRTQAVEITTTTRGSVLKTTSTPLTINRGVPQGSVLGPVLFIIFVSNLPKYLKSYCESVMYADDTVLLLKNESPTNLEIDSYIAINMAQQYCQANDLVLNGNKTQQLFLGRKKNEVENLPEINRVDQTKYLGITIDSKLNWHEHVNNLCKKLSSALYVLRRLKQVCGPDIVRNAYFSLFESHTRYGISLWGGSSKGNLQRVLILQKKAIRIIKGLEHQDSCQEAFKELKIMTVVGQFILETALYAKMKNPDRGADIHTYNTRAANNFALPAHRSTMFEKQPTYAGAKFWNILPTEAKSGNTNSLIKKRLSAWLIGRPFYTVEEFENWKAN